jgi:hypothetical protein
MASNMPDLKKRLEERIERARSSGRAVTIDSPATRDEIDRLRSRCGGLPPEILELVESVAAFSVDGIRVNFRGEEPFEFEGMFACSIPIATDGQGNFWVVDVRPDGAWGVVFFVAHDPPVAIVQARDVASFIEQLFDARDGSAISDDVIATIRKRNPHVIPREQALASPDVVVRAFAGQVDESFAIADIRDGAPGQGFVWGTAGPDTAVRRAGEELLFAIEKKKKKTGPFARLFSR